MADTPVVMEVETPVVDTSELSQAEGAVTESETPAKDDAAAEAKDEAKDSGDYRKGAFQRRINELTKQKHDALRELEYMRAQAARTTPPQPTAPTPTSKPRADDFETTEGYVDALTDWKVGQALQSQREDEEASREAEATRATLRQFTPQLDAARAKYEDFDEVTSAPIYAAHVQQAFLESPHGADVAYYLGTHPGELERINAMRPAEALRAIVKLEPRFESVQPKTVSKAPPPITPVQGSVRVGQDTSKMTAQEYYEAKRAGLI